MNNLLDKGVFTIYYCTAHKLLPLVTGVYSSWRRAVVSHPLVLFTIQIPWKYFKYAAQEPSESSFSVLPLRLAPRQIISHSICYKCHQQVLKRAELPLTLRRRPGSESMWRANYENQKMGGFCTTQPLIWALLLCKNRNLKTLAPSPPANPSLSLRKLRPVLGICHTPIIKAVDTVWSLDHCSFSANIKQWEFIQAIPTNSSITTVTIHLIRDTLSNVKMQTNVRLQS